MQEGEVRGLLTPVQLFGGQLPQLLEEPPIGDARRPVGREHLVVAEIVHIVEVERIEAFLGARVLDHRIYLTWAGVVAKLVWGQRGARRGRSR
ncbi:MAG: hypothetical protein R2873_08730 [Caldilineaceae bacterium]